MNWKDKIRDANCELCPLHAEAQHVCLMGSGSRKSEIMIIGEAPGEREDASHEAFVGPSGKLLTELLEEAGIAREDCYITNVAKCRPPSNRQPEPAEIKVCVSEYLSKEFEKVDPRWVLLLGNSALRGVVGRSGITKYRGTVYQLGEKAQGFAAYHPAYAIRNPRHLAPLRADIQAFGRLIRGEASPAGPSKVRIVRTKQGLRELRERLSNADEIAFDFETSDEGTNKKNHKYHRPWEPEGAPVVISFSVEEGQAYVVPLWHAESPWVNSWEAVLRFLKPALERKVKTIAHNGKFDCQWAQWNGVYIEETFDTMLAGHMIDENRLKGLKPMSQILLGADAYDLELKDIHNIPLRELAKYAGKDTDYTLRLYHILREELKERTRVARVFMKLMMPASNALTRVEGHGLWLDMARAQRVLVRLEKTKEKKRQKLLKYVPVYHREIMNFNSHPQVTHWLFTDLKLPILERTKKKAPSANESVLLRLAREHPAAKLLLEYREAKGHLEKVTSWVKAADSKDRVHTTYKLFGTVTGRLSSVEPNLQQVPREGVMRSCFGAPPGWVFIEADYSQIELRLAAMTANETTMLRILASGEDMHYNTASEIMGIPKSEVTDDNRVIWGKHPNFGLLYGMGPGRPDKPGGYITYCQDNGIYITMAQAHTAYTRFHETYPQLRKWHERQRNLVHRYGRVQSPIGRVRNLPDVYSGDKAVQGDAERQAINSPVQSLASDLMLMSLVRLHGLMSAREARVVGTVHDAILFEAREEVVPETVATIRRVMEDMNYVKRTFGARIAVPIEVEVKVGKHWGQGKVV